MTTSWEYSKQRPIGIDLAIRLGRSHILLSGHVRELRRKNGMHQLNHQEPKKVRLGYPSLFSLPIHELQ